MKDIDSILIKPSIDVKRNYPVNFSESDRSDFEQARNYHTQDVYLKRFSDVRISSDSVLYKNGYLITETLVSPGHKPYYQFKHLVKKVLKAKLVKLDPKDDFLLVTDNYSGGHFHWFGEVLPRLIAIEERTQNFVLLLPDSSYIKSIGLASLQLMGLCFKNIVFMKESEFYKARNVYYVNNVSKGGLNDELMKAIQRKFTSSQRGNRKIYISRQKAAFRKIVNGNEFETMLKGYGFEVLYGEDLTFEDEVNIFSSSSTLVGLHGAGLTNCIFMNGGGKVIELRKKENGPKNVGYWHLADSLDHKFYYYNGIPDSNESLVGKGCNISIPISDFEKKILHAIEV